MTREVYARFSDIDQAEAAVRALRRHCGGLQAFHIRHRDHEKADYLLPASPFALWDTSSDIIADRPAVPAAVFSGALWSDQPDEREYDGPAGRKECLLKVVVDREYAGCAAAMLHAQHGYEVFQTGADMSR
ncbi:MAG: hypothetical protein IJD13_02145 [Oscillospiraceae bacterium]|nr:hypothetical protein [Oscillospiraceae bacterium]